MEPSSMVSPRILCKTALYIFIIVTDVAHILFPGMNIDEGWDLG